MPEWSDTIMLQAYWNASVAAEEAALAVGRLEQELLRRMRDNSATSIPSEAFVCEVSVRTDYDQSRLTPLLEILNPTDLDVAYAPAHEESRMVGAKWDVRKVIALARRYGIEAQTIVEESKVPGAPRLKFSRREQGS